jgi:hypothetical protein
MLVVAAALRLALKNRLVLRALREGALWDEDVLLAALGTEIAGLIAEKEEECVRLAQTIERAQRRRGSAYAADDYRRQDVPTLELRKSVNGNLIEGLRELSEDPAWLGRQLAEARASALVEIIHPRLDPPSPPLDDRYWSERDARIAELKRGLVDLASANRRG